jgi:hypothetical protein
MSILLQHITRLIQTGTHSHTGWPCQATPLPPPAAPASSSHVSQVAVRFTPDAPQPNSLGRTATLNLHPRVRFPRSIALKWHYQPAATPVATAAVSLTADDPSRFDEPRLALALTFALPSPPAASPRNATAMLPLALPAGSLTSALAAALGSAGGGISAPSAALGVRKALNGSTLVLELGTDTSVLPLPSLLAAAVTVLPAPPPSAVSNATSSGCAFANPLFAPLPSSAAAAGLAAPPATSGVLPRPNLTAVAAGMVVTMASPGPLPPALPAAPAGNWTLSATPGSGGLDSSSFAGPLSLPFNATSGQVVAAVANLTGYAATVTVSTVREGSYLATVWNVTFPQCCWINPAVLIAAPAAGAPAGSALSAEVRPSTNVVSGTVRVSYGDSCEAVDLGLAGLTESPVEALRVGLASLPGVAMAPLWRVLPSK